MRSIDIVEEKEDDPSNRRNNSPAMRRCRPDHHLLFTPDRATLRGDIGARPPLSLLRNRTSRALNPSPSAPPVSRSCAMSASRVKQHIHPIVLVPPMPTLMLPFLQSFAPKQEKM